MKGSVDKLELSLVLYDRAPSMDFLTSPLQLVTRKTIAYWPLELRMVNLECILMS